MTYRKIIGEWFAAEGGGSLVLPDGSYGRPYDNIHMLTSIDETEDGLALVLDGCLKLFFERLKLVECVDRNLVFSKFDRCFFEWNGIGTKGDAKEYQSGQVKLVAHVLRSGM